MSLLARTPCVLATTDGLVRHHREATFETAVCHRIVLNAIKDPVRHRRERMVGSVLRHRIRPQGTKHRCFSSSAALQVSEEEVQQFEEDGAAVVRHLVSADWVERLRGAAEVNLTKPGPLSNEYVAPGQPGRFHDDQFLWMRHDVMEKFLYETPAGEIAKRMTRAKQVRLFFDELLVKEPGTQTVTPWHNDHSSWPLTGNQIVSVWLALDYIPKSTNVQYVKGSHKWKLMHKSFVPDGGDEDANLDSSSDMPDIDSKINEVELLTWDLEPGDCIVYHSLTVHGAPGMSENSNRRRAYATRWVGESVLFDPRPGTVNNRWQQKAGLDAKISPGSTMESELFPAVA